MTALRLDRVGINVSNLSDAISFYTDALGFAAGPITAEPAAASFLNARFVRSCRLNRGAQSVDLTQCDPPGAPYPDASRSNDLWFQHCALVTDDIAAAYARLCRHAFTPITLGGPQTLPGGIAAFKFRDPDGHPLELIAFPDPDPRTVGGIDHSAISVFDPAASVAFYAAELGLVVQSRQTNTGLAQDALDGLEAVSVDVIALAPQQHSPHVELLGYRTPRGRAASRVNPTDLAASRLIFATSGGEPALRIDPDGHWLVLEPASSSAGRGADA